MEVDQFVAQWRIERGFVVFSQPEKNQTVFNSSCVMKQIALLLGLMSPIWLSAQCPSCDPDNTCTSEDAFPTICPDALPDGTSGTYYEEVITFFMPGEVVDPGSGLTATLNSIVVASVVGLPFGVTWQTNSPTNTYFPNQGDNLGCATMCGTPVLPGEYEVVITVNVEASALGFIQNLTESFTLPLLIEQGEGGNATFSFDNTIGCGTVSSNFSALLDGAPGVTTYAWDFGNGQSSSEANPPTVVYNEPGEYTVSLTTTIENYNLATVIVTELNDNWCGDIEEYACNCGTPIIGVCPDPYFTIADGNGVVVYQSTVFNDVPAATWQNVNFPLTNPPYAITIWDSDLGPPLGSQDDFLGSATFNLQTGSQSFNAEGSLGSVIIDLQISNVFVNEETITVFPLPDPNFFYNEELEVLYYDDENLELFVWMLNSTVIQEGPQDSLFIQSPGVYTCQVFNSFGCTSTSSPWVICPDPDVVYDATNETISVEAGFASYQWFYNGLPIPGANANVVDASALGNYAVTITTDYGCTVTSEVFQVTVGIEEGTRLSGVTLWPNPANERISVDVPEGRWNFEVYDIGGRLIERNETIVGGAIHVFGISHLQAGSYLLVLRNEGQTRQARFMVVR